MSRKQIAIVDYGLGNHGSVERFIRALGHRGRVTAGAKETLQADLLVLPGVGAFPKAMEHLKARGLDEVIRERASLGASILGICLGMQLLADSSNELGVTPGLGLIPGKIEKNTWHIGWNRLKVGANEREGLPFHEESFFFNHSFMYRGPDEFVVASSFLGEDIPAVIRKNRVLGLQFHPEKSQVAGRELFKHLVNSLCD